MLSSGAARPASGGNQSCPTGIVASLPAVAAGRGHSCSSHRLLCNYGSFMILKIWVLLPALQVLCFLLTGWWTKAGQGWDRQFCWKAGLAYTVMKLCLGRTEASGIHCLREKIRNKVYGVMERKEILSACWCVSRSSLQKLPRTPRSVSSAHDWWMSSCSHMVESWFQAKYKPAAKCGAIAWLDVATSELELNQVSNVFCTYTKVLLLTTP